MCPVKYLRGLKLRCKAWANDGGRGEGGGGGVIRNLTLYLFTLSHDRTVYPLFSSRLYYEWNFIWNRPICYHCSTVKCFFSSVSLFFLAMQKWRDLCTKLQKWHLWMPLQERLHWRILRERLDVTCNCQDGLAFICIKFGSLSRDCLAPRAVCF